MAPPIVRMLRSARGSAAGLARTLNSSLETMAGLVLNAAGFSNNLGKSGQIMKAVLGPVQELVGMLKEAAQQIKNSTITPWHYL